MTRRARSAAGLALAAGLLAADRDAIAGLLSCAKRFFVREVRLSPEERKTIQERWGWNAQEEFYRFYMGREDQGKLVAAAVFVTEVTTHGPVRVAVGLEPDGKARGATVVELSEETYPRVEPLLDRNFTRQYAGRDAGSPFGLSGSEAGSGVNQMGHFYGRVVASRIHRGAILYDVAVLKRGG